MKFEILNTMHLLPMNLRPKVVSARLPLLPGEEMRVRALEIGRRVGAQCALTLALSRRERGRIVSNILKIASCYAALLSGTTFAGESVVVNNAWVREAPPGATVMSGYAQIANGTNRTITVTRIQSDAFDKIEIHKSEIKDGVARMEPLNKIEIKARQAVTLSPYGMHLMLIRPKKPLRAGDHITLQFSAGDGITLTADAEVRKETPDEPAQEHGHH